MDFKDKKIYLGIVGSIASGKEAVADYLKKEYGFVSFSLSFVVHQERERRKIKEFTRQTLQDIGNDLRKKYGRDILARRAISYFNNLKNTKIIIEGIRNPAEVKYLKTLPNFILIGVKTRKELRFKRLLKRAKPWDPRTWEEFLEIDKRDWGEGEDDSGQQVGKCLAMADFVLTNNGTKKELYQQVERLMDEITTSLRSS